jgi:pimeloyl-ACP methyl ester carboxylesterase
MTVSDLPFITVETENVAWQVHTCGSGKPLFFLHGFPDTPETFRHQIDHFVSRGYRLYIPWLPGYGPSTLLRHRRFYAGLFRGELKQLIKKLGHDKVDFIGHDWGAFAGLMLALEHPDLVDHLVIAAIPGFKGMKKDLLRQMYRSRYIFQFQLDGIIDRWIRKHDMQKIVSIYREWSPDWNFSDEDIAHVIDLLKQPGQLENAIGYYRATFRDGLRDKTLRETVDKPVTVNTLSVAGKNDGCIGIKCFEGQEEGFTGNFEFAVLENAGHFMHVEQPEQFNLRVTEFLEKR